MMCNKQSYCDGFPEQCQGCPNVYPPDGKYTVNNINIQISGGPFISGICLVVGCVLMISMLSNGSGKIHNVAGVILPDKYTIHNIA